MPKFKIISSGEKPYAPMTAEALEAALREPVPVRQRMTSSALKTLRPGRDLSAFRSSNLIKGAASKDSAVKI